MFKQIISVFGGFSSRLFGSSDLLFRERIWILLGKRGESERVVPHNWPSRRSLASEGEEIVKSGLSQSSGCDVEVTRAARSINAPSFLI